MEGKALEFKAKWVEEFDLGLIQITHQRYRMNKFFANRETFTAKNGVMLISSSHPASHDSDSTTFYVRGGDEKRDSDVCVVLGRDAYCGVLNAFEEYNAKRTVQLDYVKMHHRLWMKLAESGGSDKYSACFDVLREQGLATDAVPINMCFLCQDTVDNTEEAKIHCEKCKGFWGKKGLNCQEAGSYYQMWVDELDIGLRKALALRIANNTIDHLLDSLKVRPEELETALQGRKIAAIKLYRERTGRGLYEAKAAIENAVEEYQNKHQ